MPVVLSISSTRSTGWGWHSSRLLETAVIWRGHLENYDVTADLDTTSNQATDNAIPADVSAAIRALAEIFANSKGHGGYRRYVLERIDGELVFRQTEIDAAIEAALTEELDSGGKAGGRRIIKLP